MASLGDNPILKKLHSWIVFNRNVKEKLSVPDAQLIVRDIGDLKSQTASIISNSVTDVTASSPIASSGGATPNISWVGGPFGGDVVGPGSSINDDIAVFDGVTGKLIKDGGNKISDLQLRSEKDASGGYVGLTLFTINFKNVLNTFTSFFTNSNTASRTYTFQDKTGTIAMTNDSAITSGMLGFGIIGGGVVIATGRRQTMVMPNYGGTITGWDLFECSAPTPISTTTVIDIWKDSYANYPPTVADTIFGTKPSLTAATKNQATGLSIAFSANDIFFINVDSNNNAKNLYIRFTVTKS